jgi:hypothetical protein
MAVSYDTWRRTHGFSSADAPTPEEIALRMVFEKGAISPELTEAVLAAVAPELIAKTKAASQENNVAPIPPEISQMLQGGPPPAAAEAPAEPLPEEVAPPSLIEPPAAETPPPTEES